MLYQWFIGIDVSKATLDVTLMDSTGGILLEEQIKNTKTALAKFLRTLKRKHDGQKLFCLEATGYYSNLSVKTLYQAGLDVWLADGADVKNSMGLQRGKNDKVDARRIADFARRHQDRKRLVGSDFIRTMALRELISLRDYYVKQSSGLKSRLKQVALCSQEIQAPMRRSLQKSLININIQIKALDDRIKALIESCSSMKQQFQLMLSVVGIGPRVAAALLAYTRGMTAYNSPRSLASYMGIAPFEHRSGSSIRGKTRVSHRANKDLKRLLHMSAMTAIRNDHQLRAYYEKQLLKGKNKMSALNAIRNKIVHRLCAVLDRQTPYINNLPIS